MKYCIGGEKQLLTVLPLLSTTHWWLQRSAKCCVLPFTVGAESWELWSSSTHLKYLNQVLYSVLLDQEFAKFLYYLISRDPTSDTGSVDCWARNIFHFQVTRSMNSFLSCEPLTWIPSSKSTGLLLDKSIIAPFHCYRFGHWIDVKQK